MTDEMLDNIVETNEGLVIEGEAEHIESPEDNQELETQEPESQEQSEITQEAFNRAIGKKTAKMRQMERDYEAKLNEANSRLSAYEQQNNVAPEIPELKDPYEYDSDEDYRAAINERDKAIAAKAQYDSLQAILQAQQFQAQQQAIQQQQQRVMDAEKKLVENAKKVGVTEAELVESATVMNAYGLSGDIGMAIMEDPDGASIIRYLGSNPSECEKLAGMNPYMIGSYIATNIRGKANQLKPKPSAAPKPPTDVSGSGQNPDLGKYAHIGGAKFE